MQVVEQGRRQGGAHAVTALQACLDIADADESTIARMVFQKRAAPNLPNGMEVANARQAAAMDANRQAAQFAAQASRPRVSLAEQLAAMETRGIRIHTEGRHLKVHAPDGVLTDGDRTLLREHKAEILGWLQSNEETF